MKLRVVVSLPNYAQGKLGGTQTFVDSLIPRLAKDSNLEIVVLLPKGQDNGQFESARVMEYFPSPKPILGPLLGILLTNSMRFRRFIKQFDVVFFPLQSSFASRKFPIPSIVTIHDVQHLDLPKLFTFPEKIYRKFFYDYQAKGFSKIVTDSQFSMHAIARHLKIQPSRISCIYIGTEDRGVNKSISKKNFFIYPARSWKHKNHDRLFEAMRISIRKGSSLNLFLTGEPPEIPLDLRSRVKDLGRVSQHELTHLYQTATGMIFPSLYEGFGLPPIEAMSAGCPTYVSNAGSLPEICGNGSYYFDPMDIDAISDAILAMEFPDSDLIEKGIAIAREFNWDRTAQGYVQLITELADS
jgi:glycosyltransferase involved in cell wall biosynthesis